MTQQKLFGGQQEQLTTDDYYTPQWLFNEMGIVFDIDVCSPPGGPPFVPCLRYYTQADDGLTSAWSGRIWMNPPYSKPAPWVERFIRHGHGIALLPFAKSRWCETLWESKAKIVYVRAMTFYRPDVEIKSQPPFSLGLWALGDECVEAISKIGTVR